MQVISGSGLHRVYESSGQFGFDSGHIGFRSKIGLTLSHVDSGRSVWVILFGSLLPGLVEIYYISYLTKGLSIIQFGRLEPVVLHKHGLSNLVMQKGFFLVNVFDKHTVNMTSSSEVEEEADAEDGRH